jgi:lambda family phage minor tail protein L
MAYTAWQASNSYAVGDVVRPTTTTGTGLVFRCTTAGTSGSSEPTWATIGSQEVNDNTVVWLSVGAIAPEMSDLSPTSIIDLYELGTFAALHGADSLYRFHAGLTLKTPNTGVTWNGNQYTRYPIEVDGFEYLGNGQLPRPTVRVSNLFSFLSLIMIEINATNPGNDLCGAKLTRIRTMARYLDAVNFPGDTNPYGTPDPTAEAPREIYYVDRKVTENRDVVEFELVSAFDLANVRAPKRQCIANICQWKYRGTECGYSGSNYFDVNDNPVSTLAEDVCGKRLSSCELRFNPNADEGVPYGSFPSLGTYVG